MQVLQDFKGLLPGTGRAYGIQRGRSRSRSFLDYALGNLVFPREKGTLKPVDVSYIPDFLDPGLEYQGLYLGYKYARGLRPQDSQDFLTSSYAAKPPVSDERTFRGLCSFLRCFPAERITEIILKPLTDKARVEL